MRKIWKYLVQHIQQDFHASQYIFTGVFLAAALTLNYTLDIEDGFLERQRGIQKFLYYYFFYATAYYVILLSYTIFRNESAFWKKRSFWLKTTLGLTVLSLDNSIPFLRDWITNTFSTPMHYWLYKVCVNLISFITILLPLVIFYLLKERAERNCYGLTTKQFDARPYFTMLLIMLPLIIAATFNPGFLKQYPMYKTSQAHTHMNVPEWVTVAVYEIAYGLDFVTVEFLFRGFMIIGMVNVLGRKAVLAMAAIYCFLHFGKPAGEAISSIFGGYILGVIAYETRSIWGGIIVHVGIAWMMETIAFLAKH